MAGNGVAEDGAAAAEGLAQAAVGAQPVPVPGPATPADQPMAIATSGKTEILGVAASAVAHLLIGLLIIGALASAEKPQEAIPVKLIPADQSPPKPPEHPPEKSAAAQKPPVPGAQKPPAPAAQTPAPPKVPPAETAKDTAGAGNPPSPAAKATATAAEQSKPHKDNSVSLSMADSGRKTTLSAELLAALSAQAKRCWTIPSGWSDPRQVTVTLRFQLGSDGGLDGDPAIVEFPATEVGAAAAKAALTAVKQCGPYHLPAAEYDQWKDVQLKLAP